MGRSFHVPFVRTQPPLLDAPNRGLSFEASSEKFSHGGHGGTEKKCLYMRFHLAHGVEFPLMQVVVQLGDDLSGISLATKSLKPLIN
jgi:hypothetical protein